ncbi:MAG: hypothetical protein ACO20H_10335 [Bacteriovoracaceae bacterium]
MDKDEKTLSEERKEIIEDLIKKISVNKDSYYMSTYDVAVEIKKLFSNLNEHKKSKVEALDVRDIQVIMGLNSQDNSH